jgi:hypothetical protein
MRGIARTIEKPIPANDSVIPSSIKGVSAEQIQVVILSLSESEKITPADFAQEFRLRLPKNGS